MAGHDLVTEGSLPDQVGSSAMPHKTNARTCERINGLVLVLRGHLAMVGGLVGDQWNEGDISCSVVRRVALPDAFMAIDGLFQAFLTVLDGFDAYPMVAERELEEHLPFLATTRVLVALVRAGMGRETAHGIISEHATEAVRARRDANPGAQGLLDRLAGDERIPLDRFVLDDLLANRSALVGNAPAQVQAVTERIAEVIATRPEAAAYAPEPIL